MCGIYGEFFNGFPLSQKSSFLIRNDKNYHRGPDASGYWTNGLNCQFGFRRLSIIDLSKSGNQPMFSADLSYIIVFNGEIYNYKSLRTHLEDKGFAFKSTSDTEVLVNHIQYYGLDQTLEVIEGMYAFALYSKTDNAIYLVRDYAGIKPLFYSFHDKQLVFGSRYDQVSNHELNINSNIDPKVLQLYLKMHYVPAPYGIVKHTFQVEPGQIVKVDCNGKLTKKRYWEFPELQENDLITNETEALELLNIVLESSVKSHLIADVPLGTFLSGGIDSPLINYYAIKQEPKLKAFSIGSDSPIHDESKAATFYAQALGSDFCLEMMNAKSGLAVLDACVAELGEPFGDFSIIPTYQLCALSKSSCTVMLSGDGGDELFFGYERFESLLKNKSWQWIPKPLRYFAYGMNKVFFKKKHLNEAFFESDLTVAHQGMHSLIKDELLVRLFPNFSFSDYLKIDAYSYDPNTSYLTHLHAIRKAEFYGMMQKTLAKVDRMSMAHSVEVRVPFLSKAVIEASVKLHPYLSFGQGKKKELLKKLLRQKIPLAPITDNKRGFSIPLAQWLREDLKSPFESLLFDEAFLLQLNMDRSVLKEIWKEHQQQKTDHKRLLFSLYTLATWLKQKDA